MKINEIKSLISSQGLHDWYTKLYMEESSFLVKDKRLSGLLQQFETNFSESDVFLFSTPGRSEIIGNHTDHQNGKVIAASINLDMLALVAKNDTSISIISEGVAIDPIDISQLTPKQEEINSSMALIRGVTARFKELGYQYGGFHAVVTSDVLIGSGLSSSAAFEVLIANILNHLYNDGAIDAITLAKIGQYSENAYFGKPSGLMDQMACAVGNLVYIDFKEKENPKIVQLQSILEENRFKLCVVNTGGSHANLSGEYGAIVTEMKMIANYFNQELLSEIDFTDFYKNIDCLRKTVSDRAVLRAIHYDNEMKRVDDLKTAIQDKAMQAFLKLIQESGNSSFKFLQNVTLPNEISDQNIAIALSLSEVILKGAGACRVHGGGFAGTIQAFVPADCVLDYKQKMEQVFGVDSCSVLSIRSLGTCCIIDESGLKNVSSN